MRKQRCLPWNLRCPNKLKPYEFSEYSIRHAYFYAHYRVKSFTQKVGGYADISCSSSKSAKAIYEDYGHWGHHPPGDLDVRGAEDGHAYYEAVSGHP